MPPGNSCDYDIPDSALSSQTLLHTQMRGWLTWPSFWTCLPLTRTVLVSRTCESQLPASKCDRGFSVPILFYGSDRCTRLPPAGSRLNRRTRPSRIDSHHQSNHFLLIASRTCESQSHPLHPDQADRDPLVCHPSDDRRRGKLPSSCKKLHNPTHHHSWSPSTSLNPLRHLHAATTPS